jgi:Carboxypeptidase regulatory-like domain/TonB dependent receptor
MNFHMGRLAIGVFVFCNIAFGQSAELSGLIRDSSGGVVARATVTILDTMTGIKRTTKSNQDGYYDAPALQPSTYRVAATSAGFETSVREQIKLDVAEKVRLDFDLVVGSTSTVVKVPSTPQLALSDAEVGAVISSTIISQVPQYLRSWDDLASLAAGVQGYRYTEQAGSPSTHKQGQFSVHGGRQQLNNWMLDGVDDNTFSTNTIEDTQLVARPSIDAVQEFKIITSPYNAEYGRSPGASIVVSTKSGADAFHGTAYEYLRNRVFDANNFFANRDGVDKARNNQNLFGGSAGGRLIKSKLFWFGDYEGTRTRQGIVRQTTVPLPNERIGDFSPETAQTLLLKYPTIYDPLTQQAFPGNRIPASRLDTAAVKIGSYFPLPNYGSAQSGTLDFNNFVRTPSILDDTDRYSGRLDWQADDDNSVFLRYTYTPHHRDVPGYFGGIADGTGTGGWGNRNLDSHGAVAAWTNIIRPNMLNDFRIGFNRSRSFVTQEPFGQGKPSDFIPGIPSDPLSDGGLPGIWLQGYSMIGTPSFLPNLQVPQQIQFADKFAVTLGSHTMKFGADWRLMRNEWRDIPDTRGSVSFTNQFTCGRDTDGNCLDNTGIIYGDFLLGQVQEASLSNFFLADQRMHEYSFFAQDDWKQSPKLTLNLGLRYDFGSTPLEGRNRMANFDPSGQGSLYYASAGSLENRTLTRQDHSNFGPRIGLAYAITPKTVIRSGYGIFYALFTQSGSDDQLALNPPQFINHDTFLPASATQPVFQLQNGFPADYLSPSLVNLQNISIRATNHDYKTPNMQQWSFGIQRELPAGFLFETNYVGSKTTHLRYQYNINQQINGVRPYANFGPINWFENYANANYNGLEVTLNKRLGQGLTLQAAYTYSKSIDDAGGEDGTSNNSGNQQNSRDRSANRGPSDLDFTHRFTDAFVYELPFGQGKPILQNGIMAKIAGNFQLSGSMTFTTGRPFTVYASGNNSAIDANSYADVVGTPYVPGTVDCWFYTAGTSACQALFSKATTAFAVPASGHYGNAGRNNLRGPGYASADLALQRAFPLSENLRLSFRWEVFNIANSAQFANPNSDISDPAVGSITTLTADPRVMQLSLRLQF